MTGKCCSKVFLFGTLAVFAYTMAFDFLVNGVLLADLYETYKQYFRSEEEMAAYMPWCIAYHLAMSALVLRGFFCWRKYLPAGGQIGTSTCPYRKGMWFGVWVGLLLGIPQLMATVWTMIPFELPLLWCLSELVKWTLSGILLAKLYSWKVKTV